MKFLYGFILISVSSQIVSCSDDVITIGIIAHGSGTTEMETFTKHEQKFTIVKHCVDTTEVYNIFSLVQRLDADTNVDVIALLEYDVSILDIPLVLKTHRKKLIKLGARSRNQKISKSLPDKERTVSSTDTNDGSTLVSAHEDTYCLTDLNMTDIHEDNVLFNMPIPLAIRSLVKSLKWRIVIVFYESSTELEVTALVNGLSNDGVLFAMFNTDHVTDMNIVLQDIYRAKGEANKEIDVIIVCKLQNTKNILKNANNFDSLHNEKTVLKMFSRWLVVLFDYTPSASLELQNCANHLDNIAVLAVPELRNIEINVFYKGIGLTVLDNQRQDAEADWGKHEFKREFINRLQQNARLWNPTSKCQGYHIDTLLWRQTGREFSPIGYADINGTVVVSATIFPNTKYGYNKRSFLVSTLPYSPFVVKRKVNSSYIYEGFCMDLLKELATTLNFTYNLTEPADGKWGSLSNSVNVTFNGLVGQLQREEVDIVASAISVQAERDPVMDFSYPYYYGYTTVLVKKPDVNATKWRTLIDPFKWEVLLAIVTSLVIVTILVFLIEKYDPFYDVPKYAENRHINGGLHTWHSSFWYVFGALLCQGGVHLPESTAGRTLISFWWLTCIIIVGTYCGNLIAFLTVTKAKPPFNTLQEMNELKGTYKWGTIGGTVWESMFPNSSNPTFRAMGQAFIEFNKTDPTILHHSPAFHVERVKRGKYAWIGDKTYMEIATATECSLMTIKEEFMPLKYVLGFKNNSSHATIFSDQILKIHEGGLFQIWKRKWWPKSSFCAGNSITEAKPISLLDVQSAFYVCLIGIFLGCTVFMIELILHKYKTFENKKRNETIANPKNTIILRKTSFNGIAISMKCRQTRL